jgi:flagellar biogenesis protein FliO
MPMADCGRVNPGLLLRPVIWASVLMLASSCFGQATATSTRETAIPAALIEQRPLVPVSARKSTTLAPVVKPRQSDPASPTSITRTVLATASVVALVIVIGLAAKKLLKRTGGLMGALGAGGKAPSGVLQVLGRYPVASGTQLVVLKFDRRVLLIAQTGGKALRGAATMQTLCELTDPSEVASVLIKCGGEEQTKLAAQFQSILRGEDAAMDQSMDRSIVVRTPTTPALAHAREPQPKTPAKPDVRTSPRSHRSASVPASTKSDDSREAANAIRARLAAMQALDRVTVQGGAA